MSFLSWIIVFLITMFALSLITAVLTAFLGALSIVAPFIIIFLIIVVAYEYSIRNKK